MKMKEFEPGGQKKKKYVRSIMVTWEPTPHKTTVTEWQTDTCENITFQQLCLRAVTS